MDTAGPYLWSSQIIILLILFILFNALINAVYTALISLKSQKLEEGVEEGNKKAKDLLKITQDRGKLMQAFDFVDNLLSIIIVVMVCLRAFPDLDLKMEGLSSLSRGLVKLLIVMGMTMVKATFLEKIPQRIGVRNPESLALSTLSLTKFILSFNKPALGIINSVTSFFMKLFGIEAKVIEQEVTTEQIKSIVQVGENQGVIRKMESKMISSIMTFDDVLADEVMTARTEVFMIDISDEERKYLDEFVKVKHSRIPVYDGEIDNILGIVYTKDYLLEATRVGLKNVDIKKILRPAYFAPDKLELDRLFEKMQKDHIHLAILIDEYGGLSGIVTIEDLIEEIVGEIDDAFDNDIPEIRKNKRGAYIAKGSISVRDLNEAIGIGIDEDSEDYDSLAGFLINQLGYVPQDGSNVKIRYQGFELETLYIEENRIQVVSIKKLPVERQKNPEEKDEEKEED